MKLEHAQEMMKTEKEHRGEITKLMEEHSKERSYLQRGVDQLREELCQINGERNGLLRQNTDLQNALNQVQNRESRLEMEASKKDMKIQNLNNLLNKLGSDLKDHQTSFNSNLEDLEDPVRYRRETNSGFTAERQHHHEMLRGDPA